METLLGQNQGFFQERLVKDLLDGKKVSEIPTSFKNILEKMFRINFSGGETIKCFKKEGLSLEKKSDLNIEILNKIIRISIKRGNSNSCHQEPFSEFLTFLDEEKKLKKDQEDLLNLFHWCDHTTDNSGKVGDRLSKTDFKKIYVNEYRKYLKILREYKKEIFYRVWVGSKNSPQYLLYFSGRNSIPQVIDFEALFQKHTDFDDSVSDSIGLLTIQNWNACLRGQDHGHISHNCDASCPKMGKSGKHRNDVQFKSKDIEGFVI